MVETQIPVSAMRVWQVGALCRAVADALDARFNPVAVSGEISGLTRASSGHCYFLLKDETGQIRCAMFRRATSLLDFSLKDGEQVEVRGRLGVYESRGDLQLIVESVSRAGRGALFEQFLRLKAKLEAEGLFDAGRKRALPAMPRGIGVVTSLGAAALHDVVTALQRRVPHVAVIVVPASVQGANAPAELTRALQRLDQYASGAMAQGAPAVDAILLVRGGGSMEDLWAFNDEQLARAIARCSVPVVSGVGHETDFTIADFVADLRAPTPTAAAELVAQPRAAWLGALDLLRQRMRQTAVRRLDGQGQRLDQAADRLGRPSALAARQRLTLSAQAQRLRFAVTQALREGRQDLTTLQSSLPQRLRREFDGTARRLERAAMRLQLLDPARVLRRGYAWVSDEQGRVVTRAGALVLDQRLRVRLAQGQVDVKVTGQEKGPH